MERDIGKREIEEMIGCGITDDQFSKALGHAVVKQQRIYECRKDTAVLQHQYLVGLVCECASDLVLARTLLSLYGAADMKKERWARSRNAKNRQSYYSSPSVKNQGRS